MNKVIYFCFIIIFSNVLFSQSIDCERYITVSQFLNGEGKSDCVKSSFTIDEFETSNNISINNLDINSVVDKIINLHHDYNIFMSDSLKEYQFKDSSFINDGMIKRFINDAVIRRDKIKNSSFYKNSRKLTNYKKLISDTLILEIAKDIKNINYKSLINLENNHSRNKALLKLLKNDLSENSNYKKLYVDILEYDRLFVNYKLEKNEIKKDSIMKQISQLQLKNKYEKLYDWLYHDLKNTKYLELKRYFMKYKSDRTSLLDKHIKEINNQHNKKAFSF